MSQNNRELEIIKSLNSVYALLPFITSEYHQNVRKYAKFRMSVVLRSMNEDEKERKECIDTLFHRLENITDSWEQRNIVEVLYGLINVDVDKRLVETLKGANIHPMVRERGLYLLAPAYAKYNPYDNKH